ncbi:tRNA pseudouridine(38-40) synthase TruA [Stakelama sp. CBK3Z-3]|uniref:tRNA pseudouridine synthase A n=1 Tax=Stakelama flava TaxID=2860338 RepID=A0ABS6XPB4_9SPHN|nr:tRNA pseudouridine(38-40) synthase TruA [Stakelama flava]
MTRFALTIEYDGRPFMGWQRQRHGPSVQQAIEEAIYSITGEEVLVYASGRTDSGVHALAMRAHVDIEKPIEPFHLMGAINARVRPNPVAILDCREVADDWHARFSCVARAYEYRIVNRRAPLTWEAGLAWQLALPLDVQAMQAAAEHLIGRHDFTTFRSVHCQAESPVRTLDRLTIERTGDRITVRTGARSFLHHQVRSMVGCLSLVGHGKWTPDDMRAALHAHDRAALGLNAPADGLYFVSAAYPD